MDLKRIRNEMTVELAEADAAGLYAVMNGTPASVTPEVFARGQEIYKWLFENVQTLAINFERETPPTIVPKYKR